MDIKSPVRNLRTGVLYSGIHALLQRLPALLPLVVLLIRAEALVLLLRLLLLLRRLGALSLTYETLLPAAAAPSTRVASNHTIAAVSHTHVAASMYSLSFLEWQRYRTGKGC